MQIRSPYFSPIEYRKHTLALPYVKNQDVQLARIEQHHANNCVEASEYGFRPKADACFTKKPLLACSVVVADCIPVLLAHKTQPWIAAIHAGWRGLYQEIIRHSIAKCPYPVKDLQAWIGPSISKNCYTVGNELVTAFIQANAEYKPYFAIKNEKHVADLSAIAKHQLNALGVKDITLANICTYTHKNLPSFRRDGEKSGRLLCTIWREDI